MSREEGPGGEWTRSLQRVDGVLVCLDVRPLRGAPSDWEGIDSPDGGSVCVYVGGDADSQARRFDGEEALIAWAADQGVGLSGRAVSVRVESGVAIGSAELAGLASRALFAHTADHTMHG
jgi:hypothetical protein